MARTQPASLPDDAHLDDQIAELIARQPKGCSLLQEFYSDPDIYERDIERIFLRRWLLAGHEDRTANPGDWFLFEVAGESVIIVRGKDGNLRALMNVCRHRGSHVCYEKSGNAKLFVCPYHAWSYDLDGTLKAARHMGKDIDKAAFGLKPIHLRLIEGLIFVNFSDDPIATTELERNLHASLRPYVSKGARIAARETFTFKANWKLAVENYVECYHCRSSHPEYSELHANELPVEDGKLVELTQAMHRKAGTFGVDIPASDHWATPTASGEEGTLTARYALYEGFLTGSQGGKPVAPLMGDFVDYDLGVTYIHMGPTCFIITYPDHVVLFRFLPVSADETELELIWLVHPDAKADTDYRHDTLTWLWVVTSIADKKIVENNQRGIDSRFYEPGPYTPMEVDAIRMSEWYLNEIR
jgi:phenylpropionate dioxygenase-like ring-hydroxylating dioxygenase large terminal subunit